MKKEHDSTATGPPRLYYVRKEAVFHCHSHRGVFIMGNALSARLCHVYC